MLIFLQWLHKKDREKDLSMIVKKERERDFSIFLQWLYRMEKERLNCWFFFNNYIKRRKRVILIVLVYQWLYNYTRWPPPKKGDKRLKAPIIFWNYSKKCPSIWFLILERVVFVTFCLSRIPFSVKLFLLFENK